MKFIPTSLPGAFVIEMEAQADERGFFGRTFCVREFQMHGLAERMVQCSLSGTHRRGTIRGLHYQSLPAPEVKLVRCVRGVIHDVIVDLRPDSPAYGRHFAVELSAQNHRALYVPTLCAHGFQTQVDDTEVYYQMSASYEPALATGVRFDDPKLGIRWPLPVAMVSEKDRKWPLLP